GHLPLQLRRSHGARAGLDRGHAQRGLAAEGAPCRRVDDRLGVWRFLARQRLRAPHLPQTGTRAARGRRCRSDLGTKRMAAAIFGLIGVVIGALINGIVTWLSQRRKDEATERSAKRLVANELGTWLVLAREAQARPPEHLPQLRKATPLLWQ